MNNPKSGQPIVSHGPKAGYLTRQAIADLLAAHGFANVDAWVKIVMRESGGGDPAATVDTRGMSDDELHTYWGKRFDGKKLLPEYSAGLFQVNLLANLSLVAKVLDHPEWSDPANAYGIDSAASSLREAENSMKVAFALSSGGQNFGPWGGKP